MTNKLYVFIHNPKTGGDTITALLNIKKTHTYINLRKDKILNKYSFVFVRHPVTRMISWYNHLLKHLYFKDLETNELNDKSESYKCLKNNYKMGPDKHRILAENNNINDWIKILFLNIDEYKDPDWGPLSLQCNYVYDLDYKTQLVTDVYRFENYEEELKKVLVKIEREDLIKDIKVTNNSKQVNEILNKESLDLIFNYFKKDFELFNYKI
jgi:hypothetical protein